MPKYYECIRAYLYRNNYNGEVYSGEGIYSLTENILDDNFPNLNEITRFFGINKASDYITDNIKAYIYNPDVTINATRHRTFSVSFVRHSMEGKIGRRGNDDEQVNILFATEIPENKYSTAVFKADNRIVTYGDIPILDNVDMVEEEKPGLLSKSEVIWEAKKEEITKDLLELLKAFLHAQKTGKSVYFIHDEKDNDKAVSTIFALIEHFPPALANEISFNTCCTTALSSSERIDICGIPTTDPAYISELSERGEVVILGKKYEGETGPYIELLNVMRDYEVEEFKQNYLSQCRSLSALDDYAKLFLSLDEAHDLETAKIHLDNIFEFLSAQISAGTLSAKIRNDAINAYCKKLELVYKLEESSSALYESTTKPAIALYNIIKSVDTGMSKRLISQIRSLSLKDFVFFVSCAEQIKELMGEDYEELIKILDDDEGLDNSLAALTLPSICTDSVYDNEALPLIRFYTSLRNKSSRLARELLMHIVRMIFASDAVFFVNNFRKIEADIADSYPNFIGVLNTLCNSKDDTFVNSLCTVPKGLISSDERLFNELIRPTISFRGSLNKEDSPLGKSLLDAIFAQTFVESARVFFSHFDSYGEILDEILKRADAEWSTVSRLFDSTLNSMSATEACEKITTRLVSGELYNREITSFFVQNNLRHNEPYKTVKLFYNENNIPNSIDRITALAKNVVQRDTSTAKKITDTLLRLIRESQDEFFNDNSFMELKGAPVLVAAKHFAKIKEDECLAGISGDIVSTVQKLQEKWYVNPTMRQAEAPLKRVLIDLERVSDRKPYTEIFKALLPDVAAFVMGEQQAWRDTSSDDFSASPLARALTAIFARKGTPIYDNVLTQLTDKLPKELEIAQQKWAQAPRAKGVSPIERALKALYGKVAEKYFGDLFQTLLRRLIGISKQTSSAKLALVETVERIITHGEDIGQGYVNAIRGLLVKEALGTERLKAVTFDEESLDMCDSNMARLIKLNEDAQAYNDFIKWYEAKRIALTEKNRLRRLTKVRTAEISAYISQMSVKDLRSIGATYMGNEFLDDISALERCGYLDQKSNSYEDNFKNYYMYKLTGDTRRGFDKPSAFSEIKQTTAKTVIEIARAMETHISKPTLAAGIKNKLPCVVVAIVFAIAMAILARVLLPIIYNGFFKASVGIASAISIVAGVLFAFCGWQNRSKRRMEERIPYTILLTVLVSAITITMFVGIHWLVSTIV